MIITPYKLLSLFCLICTLAFVVACKGINITGPDVPVPGSYNRSSASGPLSSFIDTDFLTALPQVGNTTATTPSAFDQSLYAFTNSASAANFVVSWKAALRDGARAGTETFLALIGAHDLHYELQGSYVGLFAQGDAASFYTALGYRNNRGNVILPFEEFYSVFDEGLCHYWFSSSGTLPAGNLIQLLQYSALHGILEEDGRSAAVGSGFCNLKLTENHVPDGGSTVILLAIALGGLGFIRKYSALCWRI
jgi:hypothetical protein